MRVATGWWRSHRATPSAAGQWQRSWASIARTARTRRCWPTTEVDAIYIPLPNHLHREWAIRALEAGKHVLCEKPLAMTAADAEEMVDGAERTGMTLMEAFMYRLHPSWVAVLDLVASGRIGRLTAIQSWFSYYNDDPDNIRNIVAVGGGALYDIGCYNVNLSRTLFGGEPTRVQSSVVRDPLMGVDILTSAILDFPGGQATFTCTTRTETDQRVHVYGTNGRISIGIPFNIPPDRPTEIFVTAGGDPPISPRTEVITFPVSDPYTVEAEAFAAIVLDGCATAVPGPRRSGEPARDRADIRPRTYLTADTGSTGFEWFNGRVRDRRIIVLVTLVAVVTLAVIGVWALVAGSPGIAGVAQRPFSPRYIDEAQSAGVTHAYTGDFEYFVGGGVAAFDCSADVLPDLYFAGGSQPAALFVNRSAAGGALAFERRAAASTDLTAVIGAYPIDIDNDGITDLAVLRRGENQLLRGARRLPLRARQRGLGRSTAAMLDHSVHCPLG